MGTTAKGYPYPDPTGSLADADLAIKALAEAVDDQLVTKMTMGATGITTDGSGQATINHGLGGTPTVFLPIVSGTATYLATLNSVGATNCTITIRNLATGSVVGSGTNLTIRWLAVR